VDDLAWLPYLGFRGDSHPIKMAVDHHRFCKRRVGSKSANPYVDICHGFHITFYESLGKEGRELKRYEQWETGNLYKLPAALPGELNPDASDPDASDGVGEVFRQSAFTVSSLSLDKSNK
jgi:hypothetical protein